MHWQGAVLISPPTIENQPVSGSVSSRPAVVDETTGFSSWFQSADAELSNQWGSPAMTIAESPVWPAAVPPATVESQDESQAQTDPNGSSSQVVGPAVSSPLNTDAAPSIMDRSAEQGTKQSAAITRPRRDNRPISDQDIRGKQSSQDKTSAGAQASLSQAPLPQASATPVAAGQVPAALAEMPGRSTPAQSPLAISWPQASGGNHVHEALQAYTAPHRDSRTDTNLSNQPQQSLAAAAPEAPAKQAGTEAPQALAFAVKVQAANTLFPPSRVSSLDSKGAANGANQPAASGAPTAADTDDTSSPVQAAAQTGQGDAGQTGSHGPEGGTAGGKDKPAAGESTQAFLMPDGQQSMLTTSEVNELPGVAAAGTEQPGSALPGQAVQVPEPASAGPSAAPVKEISMQVEAAEGQKVDIRIVQRGGDLRIAVKSADNDTTQGLRHGLSDLANRLNESGYHAETWRPGQPATAESAASSGDSQGSPSDRQPSDGSQSQSGNSGQNRGQRDNNQSNRPRWIQELESNLGSGTAAKGQFNGIGS